MKPANSPIPARLLLAARLCRLAPVSARLIHTKKAPIMRAFLLHSVMLKLAGVLWAPHVEGTAYAPNMPEIYPALFMDCGPWFWGLFSGLADGLGGGWIRLGEFLHHGEVSCSIRNGAGPVGRDPFRSVFLIGSEHFRISGLHWRILSLCAVRWVSCSFPHKFVVFSTDQL